MIKTARVLHAKQENSETMVSFFSLGVNAIHNVKHKHNVKDTFRSCEVGDNSSV